MNINDLRKDFDEIIGSLMNLSDKCIPQARH